MGSSLVVRWRCSWVLPTSRTSSCESLYGPFYSFDERDDIVYARVNYVLLLPSVSRSIHFKKLYWHLYNYESKISRFIYYNIETKDKKMILMFQLVVTDDVGDSK